MQNTPNPQFLQGLKMIFGDSYSKLTEICKDQKVINLNSAVKLIQQQHYNQLTDGEKNYMKIFMEVENQINDEQKSSQILQNLIIDGVQSLEDLQYFEDEDWMKYGLNKNILNQLCLPEEFEKFLDENLKYPNVLETKKLFLQKGIMSQDQLFLINEDEAINYYKIPKMQFRKLTSRTRPQSAIPTNIIQQTQKQIIQPTKSFEELKQEELKNQLFSLAFQTKIIIQKNGLDIHQYPIYQKKQILDLQEYKTIIMIGQTGSGKSTLINFFLNYYLGIKFEDSFRFFLIDESNLNISKSQAISQTQDVMIYYIKPANGNPGLRIIDTPGFGDTRGIAQDKIIAEKIHNCFKEQVDTLTTICFLVQSSNARLTVNQNYILSSILQMFGVDVIQNFVFMFTFCDGGNPQAEEALRFQGNKDNSACPVAHLIDKITPPWYLKFNSSAFLAPNNDAMNKLFWQIGMSSFQVFVEEKIKSYKDVSLKLTRDVIKQRETIMNVICHLRPKIQQQLLMMEEHKQIHKIIEQLNAAMIDSKNYTIETTKFKMEEIRLSSGQYVTNCVRCNYTCHFPCVIPDNESKSGCAAMNSSGYCNVCTSKCYWNVHKNMSFRYESKTYKEKSELTELKQKYMNSESTKSSKEQILEGIERDYENISFECMQKQEELMEAVNKLNVIALQPAVCKHQEEYVDIMIQEEQNKKEAGWVERVKALEDMKNDWKTLRETATNGGQVKLTREFLKSNVKIKKLGVVDRFKQYFA